MFSNILAVIALVASFALAADQDEKHGCARVCHGRKGAQGPVGPSGFPGYEGSQGIQGEQGLPGPVGTMNTLWCTYTTNAAITIPDNDPVPFDNCKQTRGYRLLGNSTHTRFIQVLEDGIYEVWFYAAGGAETFIVDINGADAAPAIYGGTFSSQGSAEYTQGQFVVSLLAETVISITSSGPSIIADSKNAAVAASVIVSRVAQLPM